jgi:aryl-alcohol dehydrogenase-like predicted oxidoreductase
MKYRTLGYGLTVSAIGIGCMPMIKGGNFLYGEAADLDESIRTIHRAIDQGVTFFDTAEVYGPFGNEELLGEAIKDKRDGLVIATKFGFKFDGSQILGVDGSPQNARRACEGSLKRLGIDCIDLFYQHRVDPAIPIEEVVGGMMELVQEGKVRHIALSEAGPETLRRAAKAAPITALQSEYSIWERDIEDEILGLTRRSAEAFWRARYAAATTCLKRTGAGTTRAIRKKTCPLTWPSSMRLARSAIGMACPRPKSRSPGCSRRATTSSPSPAPSAARRWRTALGPPT